MMGWEVFAGIVETREAGGSDNVISEMKDAILTNLRSNSGRENTTGS
jgi:hypothetical protein